MVSDEEKAHRLKKATRARKLAQMGRPQRVLPREYDHGMRILTKAHDSGMSYTQIADQVGTSRSTVAKLMQRHTETMHRDTYNLLLKLQPEPPARSGATRRGGAKVDPTTTTRRLRALVASGWTSKSMAPYIGMDQRNLSSLVLGKIKFVYAITQREVATAYDKLQHMDPLANGTTPIGYGQAKARALSYGWAPTWAWDEDTIDDPAAPPEWTGACGTPEGYTIHLRERIKACQPCVDASRSEERTGGSFSPTKFRILMEQRGFTTMTLAKLTDATDDSIRRWAGGERRPKGHFLTAICSALDCTQEDLLDRDGEAVYHDTDFNRHALRAVLDAQGRSIRGLAIEIGVSNMAVTYWLSGKNTPKIPKIVKAAEILGVDWQEFYR